MIGSPHPLPTETKLKLLFWAPLIAASAHIVEEFVWPGGFLEWHRRYRPEQSAGITPRFAWIANALLLFLCAGIVIDGSTPIGFALWLTVAALLFTNALFHLRGTLRSRAYSPGVVTGLCLYVPLCLAGYYWFLRTGAASVGTAIGAFLLGGSYPFLSAFLHRRRARKVSSGRTAAF